jgi:gliding motility-associated protein GldE
MVMALLSLVILLICSGLISGSEVAYFSLTAEDLNELESEKKKVGARVRGMREEPRTLLGTILVANNFINIAIVVISEYIIWNFFSNELFNEWSRWILEGLGTNQISASFLARTINFLITVFGITFLLVLFGEIAPKIYARIHNKTMAGFMSVPLSVLNRIFAPITFGLVKMSNGLERILSRSSTGMSSSNEDLDNAIELTMVEEGDTKEEADILKGIVKFNRITVKQIMRSRVDVVGLEFNATFGEVMTTIKESGYSRLPVFKEDFDNVMGILYVKDLIQYLEEPADYEWQPLMRNEVLYIPETKKINELLNEFQEKRMHLAIVVDEYGGSSGIVTLDDVMEEVIGDIKDESDIAEEPEFMKIDDHNYVFEGKMQLIDVCRVLDLSASTFDEFRGESDTIAGLILETHGFIPKKNQEFDIGESYKLKAIKVNKRRIEKVQMTILE